jgi:hypothetical protein
MAFDPSTAWAPSLSCPTWSDAHRTAAAMQQGGVLLRTASPPAVGSDVHLTLRFPDGSDVILVGDVLEVRDQEGVVVRFRVAAPILSQLEARAVSERSVPRPARPLARGSSEPGTTYSIHRKKK